MTRAIPKTLFHGTAGTFSAFDVDKGSPGHPDGLGAWLSESEPDAADFAETRGRESGKGVVLHVEQAFANPLVLHSYEQLKGLIRSDRGRSRVTRERLRAVGYDAVVIDRSAGLFEDDARDVIALDASKLRIVDRVALEDRPRLGPRP